MLGCVFVPQGTMSQSKLTIGNGTYLSCAHSALEIPVIGEQIFNVTSLTLTIKIDTTNIVYDTAYGNNEIFQGGVFMGTYNDLTQSIILTWSANGSNSTDIKKDTICTLKFYFKTGETTLDFIDVCEMSDPQLQIISGIDYIGGVVHEAKADSEQIIALPKIQEIYENTYSSIYLNEVYGNVERYQWEKKNNETWEELTNNTVFQGVNSRKLTIFAPDTMLNNTQYRCSVMMNNCEVNSSTSYLKVNPYDDLVRKTEEKGEMIIFPNPTKAQEILIQSTREIQDLTVKIYDLDGQMLCDRKVGYMDRNQVARIFLHQFSEGTYIVQIFSEDNLLETRKVIKESN